MHLYYKQTLILPLYLTTSLVSATIASFMFLQTLQVIFAVLLVVAIIMQQKGTGLGSAFGGGGNIYRSTKRGGEKVLHIATIVFAIIFFGLLVADIFIA